MVSSLIKQVILSLIFHVGFIRASLVSNSTAVCASESISFTCTLPGTGIRWRALGRATSTSVIMGFPSSSIALPEGTLDALYVDEADGTVTSTLTSVTDVSLLNGTLIECDGIGGGETVTAGPVAIILAGMPSQPLSLQVSYLFNQPNVSLVTLQWDPPSDSGGATVSYELTVSPTPLSGPVSDTVNTTQQITMNYNNSYNISVRAVNCAGVSDQTLLTFVIASCSGSISPADRVESLDVPPVTAEESSLTFNCNGQVITSFCSSNGSWIPDPEIYHCPSTITCNSPGPPSGGSVFTGDRSPPYLNGTTITYQCDDGLFPLGLRTSVCAVGASGSGEWIEDPSQLVCFIQSGNCSLPLPPSNGIIVGYERLNSTMAEGTVLTYQCDSGLVLTGITGTIMCGNDGQWSQDPLEIMCINQDVTLSTSVAISAVISFIVALIVGFLLGLLVMYLFTRQKSSPGEGQVTTAVYDEVDRKQQVKLTSNQAYGHIELGVNQAYEMIT